MTTEGNRGPGPVHHGEGNDAHGRGCGLCWCHSPATPPQETNALTAGGPHYNVSEDGTLVIARPSPRDAGAYVCTATNSVGFSSQEMRLSVNSE